MNQHTDLSHPATPDAPSAVPAARTGSACSLDALQQSLRDCKAWDDNRPGWPGEHWLVFGAGIALLLAAGRSRSPLGQAVGSAIGSALLYRAASGRDGLRKLLPYVAPATKLLR